MGRYLDIARGVADIRQQPAHHQTEEAVVVTRESETLDLFNQILDAEVVTTEPDGLQIPAERLLRADRAVCYACGQTRWWDNGGRRICAVCHPPPIQISVEDQAG